MASVPAPPRGAARHDSMLTNPAAVDHRHPFLLRPHEHPRPHGLLPIVAIRVLHIVVEPDDERPPGRNQVLTKRSRNAEWILQIVQHLHGVHEVDGLRWIPRREVIEQVGSLRIEATCLLDHPACSSMPIA